MTHDRARAASLAVAAIATLAVLAPALARAELPVLRVGISEDYAPFSLDGEGFDVDVARRLAADLGMQAHFARFRWHRLQAAVKAGRFDIAMSGITWRPARSIVGYMSLAVASGGPCLISAPGAPAPAPAPESIGVNRGGILEKWTRKRFSEARIVTVDDNTTLPKLLAEGEVAAIATDSFERAHFERPGQTVVCEPRRDRKVYWISPEHADELGPRVDAWIEKREPWLAELRSRHFGETSQRVPADLLIDLMARRLALMPFVGRWKRQHRWPIEDLEREKVVLDRVEKRASEAGLDRASARRFFEVQIELAKALQHPRTEPDAESWLDLPRELRPVLLRLGDRIIARLAAQVPVDPAQLDAADLTPLEALLDAGQRQKLRAALLGVRRAK